MTRPKHPAADKDCSYPGIRRRLSDRPIDAVIPHRSDQLARYNGMRPRFDQAAYRKRNAVERCVGWLKECRHFAMRYDKLAENFLAMIDLALIQRYLAMGFSDTA